MSEAIRLVQAPFYTVLPLLIRVGIFASLPTKKAKQPQTTNDNKNQTSISTNQKLNQKMFQQYITGSSTGKNIISTTFLEDHLNLNRANKHPRSSVTFTTHFPSGSQGTNIDSGLLGEYYF